MARGPIRHEATGSLRLGFGETVDSTGFGLQFAARSYFLSTVEAVRPDVFRELYDAFLDRFSALLWDGIATPFDVPYSAAHVTAIAALKSDIHAWAVRWRLESDDREPFATDWAFTQLLERVPVRADINVHPPVNVEDWDTRVAVWMDSIWDGRTGEMHLATREPTFPLPPIVFPSTAWNPRRETRSAARSRILGDLTRELDRQFDAIETVVREAGDRPTPMKESDLHFVWLVRYQVSGERVSEIAATPWKGTTARVRDRATVARQTVQEAVVGTAVLVGLPLREPDPRGRPRKPRPPRIVRIRTQS